METFESESCVRGYHIYQELWEAAIGEDLECQRERGNTADAYAVSVLSEGIEEDSDPLGSGRPPTGFM